MTSPGESFVISLSRASKRARRYLRGLEPADRDDVLATAILWCWENRSTYQPSVALEDWFVGAVRHARRDWELGEAREAVELTETIPTHDDTSARVEALDAAEKLAAALTPEYQRIAARLAKGETFNEIESSGVSGRLLRDVSSRLRQLRKLVPEEREYRQVIRGSRAACSDEDATEKTAIDREIERLEFPPAGGAECPPCWRCKWFEGFLPSGTHKLLRVPITEPELRDAVRDVEARKLIIAQRVRAGTIFEE